LPGTRGRPRDGAGRRSRTSRRSRPDSPRATADQSSCRDVYARDRSAFTQLNVKPPPLVTERRTWTRPGIATRCPGARSSLSEELEGIWGTSTTGWAHQLIFRRRLANTRRATPKSHGNGSPGTSPRRRHATRNTSATRSSASLAPSRRRANPTAPRRAPSKDPRNERDHPLQRSVQLKAAHYTNRRPVRRRPQRADRTRPPSQLGSLNARSGGPRLAGSAPSLNVAAVSRPQRLSRSGIGP
jgi:hypothetical protein